MNLSEYQEDVRDLLRDDFAQFFSTKKINRYINRARVQTALQSKCIRILVAGSSPAGSDATVGNAIAGAAIPGSVGNAQNNLLSIFSTIANVEKYPYSFANPLIQQQNAGVKGVVDVLGVAVSWGGTTRPALAYMPWDNFQAYCRAVTTGATSYPLIFSKYQDGQSGSVWMFPVPSVASEMDWDCICVPIPLVDDSTPEALPDPNTNAVKFYAAKLAYQSSSRFGMADLMEEEFQHHLVVNSVASESGATPDYYMEDTW